MTDAEIVAFLQWVLPRLQMRWPGFRRVRGQVRRRINMRLGQLGLPDTAAYRVYLEAHAAEWKILDGFCRVTVSRFRRNRGVFEFLFDTVLPALCERAVARGEETLGVWCVGCASGEEAYTITIGWEVRMKTTAPPLGLSVVASDADAHMVERARAAEYPPSSLRELPQEWRCEAFDARDDTYRLRTPYRRSVTVRHEDVRTAMPDGPFDLILCRNLVFTYYEKALQRRLLQEMACRLVPGGGLLLGHHETLPKGVSGFTRWDAGRGMYRRTDEECAEGEWIT